MPSLRRDEISGPDLPEANDRSESPTWITAVVIAASILVAAAFITAVLVYFRRRGYREAIRRDPSLSSEEYVRRRMMSAAALQEEEERQRNIMIRKSLASRSFDWSSQSDRQSLDADESMPTGLKEDWKEWEARMRRERSDSVRQHPASSPIPDMPMPKQSRSRSPSRSPLLRGQSPPLSTGPPRRPSLDKTKTEASMASEPTQPMHVYTT